MLSMTAAHGGGCLRAGLVLRFVGSLKNAKQYKTSAPLCSSTAKTPIQQWGWEYLLRQRALKRPISPHLSIYQPQLTWYVSGLHRITGCVMAGVLLTGSVGFALLPIDFPTVIDFIRSMHVPSLITSALKFIIAFPLVFHSINGIRFLGFDMAKGTDIKSVYRSGYAVLALSLLIALYVTLAAPSPVQHRPTMPSHK